MPFEEWEVIKDPDEVKDYGINWAPQLTSPETIVSSTWTIVSGTGLVIDTNTFGTDNTTVWLSGGTKGVTYQLRNRIVTNNVRPRTLDMTVRLKCAEK